MGGLSGPCVFPIALRMVYQVSRAVKIPVVGIGGISSAEDVAEMTMAGASAVQIGSAALVEPYALINILDDLPEVLTKLRLNNYAELIGASL
jgi:dihydroorotate dehydrogenase (NAD+) catalytic subunit